MSVSDVVALKSVSDVLALNIADNGKPPAGSTSRSKTSSVREKILVEKSNSWDITERNEAQQALQKLAEMYQMALDAADMGAWDYDLLSTRFFGDERCREIFGVPHVESLSVDQVREMIHPDDRSRVSQAVQEAMNSTTDGRCSVEYRVFWPNGSMHWIHARGQVSFRGEGEVRKPVRFTGVIKDITEQKTAEERLVRREKRLQQFIGAMDEIVFEFDCEGRYLNAWSENEDLLKRPRQELLGKRVEEIVPKEMAEKLLETFKQIRMTGSPVTFEYPLEVIGGRRWFLARIALVEPIESGEPTFSFLARDITERKELEKRLQESERKFHGIFDNSFQFFALLDTRGKLIEVNRTACTFLGIERSLVAGKSFWKTPWWTHSPELQKRLRQAIENAAQGECVRFESTHIDANDQEHVIDFTLKPFGEKNRTELLIAEGRDITDRKRAEEDLRLAHRQLQNIVEFSPDPTFVIDRDKKVIAWNRAIEEMTGVRKEEILGQGDYAYALPFYGERRPVLIDMVDCPISKIKERYEKSGIEDRIRYVETYIPSIYGGKGAYVWATASALCDQDGNLVAAIESVRDISDRKQAENALKEANRELDAFVHTVSHDLRTPLTPIIGYTQVLRTIYRERLDEQGLEILSEIEQCAEGMLSLLENLLALAKAGKIKRTLDPVSADSAVHEVVKNLKSSISDTGLEVKVEDLPSLHIHKTLLIQIFSNLIGNAIQYAGPQGGPIEVGGARSGEWVRLYVRDHGPGIPKGETNNIFNLFSRGSTGSEVQGTGVGLATVKKIASHYEGKVWVEDTPGGGATFWVEFRDIPD